jgi:NitT/TauT family transport system substrate-binding protein
MIRLFDVPPQFEGDVALTMSVVNTPDIMIARILNGETDIASLPTNAAVRLYNKGAGYILGGVTGYGLLYVVSSDTALTSLNGLRGRRIHAVGRGSTPEYVLKFLLSRQGIDADEDVEIDFTMNQIELSQSIIAGRVDTALLPEPFVTRVLSAGPALRIAVDLQQEWEKFFASGNSYPMSCVVVSSDFWDENPGIVRTFLDHYAGSIDWVRNNPAKAGKLIEKHGFGIPGNVAEQAIPRLNLRFLGAREARDELEDYLQVLYDFTPASIGGSLPDEDFYGK